MSLDIRWWSTGVAKRLGIRGNEVNLHLTTLREGFPGCTSGSRSQEHSAVSLSWGEVTERIRGAQGSVWRSWYRERTFEISIGSLRVCNWALTGICTCGVSHRWRETTQKNGMDWRNKPRIYTGRKWFLWDAVGNIITRALLGRRLCSAVAVGLYQPCTKFCASPYDVRLKSCKDQAVPSKLTAAQKTNSSRQFKYKHV